MAAARAFPETRSRGSSPRGSEAGAGGAGPPIRDLGIRLAGIPLCGIIIPNVTGVFGPLGPRSPVYWLGYAWFILLSLLVWQGNRFFLVRLRRRYDWPAHRSRKLLLLLASNLFYTTPVVVVMMAAWYRFAGFPRIDWNAVPRRLDRGAAGRLHHPPL